MVGNFHGVLINYQSIIQLLMASLTLIFFNHMLFVQVSLQMWFSDKEDRKQDRARVSSFVQCHAPWTGLLSQNLKPRKTNSEGLP